MFVFLLLFIISFVTACPTGYTSLSTGKCVKFTSGLVANFSDAEASCESLGGKLTSITNAIDNSAILRLTMGSIWLGMKCDNSSRCSWIDSSSVNYNNFAIGQPSIDSGKCVIMTSNGKWTSSTCDGLKLGYICESVPKCVGTTHITSDQDTLTSPNYPATYIGTTGSPCSYVIKTSPLSQAAVQFPILDLDQNSTISVYTSELSTSPMITLTSQNTGNDTWFYSTTNILKIVFDKCSGPTCDTTSIHNWVLHFSASNLVLTTPKTFTDGCNEGVRVVPGVITSPNYPGLYPNNLDCQYAMSAPYGFIVYILFNSVNTEPTDYITITDAASMNEIGRLSGSYEDNTQGFLSANYSMIVTFKTGSSGQKSGFKATYMFFKV